MQLFSLPDTLANDAVLQRYVQRMQADPDSIAFVAVADLLLAHGFAGDAVRICEGGIAQNPDVLTAKLTLARARAELGETVAARKILESVLQALPDHPQAKQLLAELSANTLLAGNSNASAVLPSFSAAQTSAALPPTAVSASKTAPNTSVSISSASSSLAASSGTLAPPARPAISDEQPIAPPIVKKNSEPSTSVPPPREKIAKPATPMFYTLTMARLYAAQGFRADAIAIYERLIEQEPDNQTARTELAQLRASPLAASATLTTAETSDELNA